MDLFHWKCSDNVPVGNYFVGIPHKRYTCQLILNEENLWIYFIENGEKKYHLWFILLKILILWHYLKQRRAVDLFNWKCWNKVPLGIYFVETPDRIYGGEFISNKEELWIYFIENFEIKYSWRFILLKYLIKCNAVNLFKTKKSHEIISLEMLKESTTGDLFCSTSWEKVRVWIYLKQREAVDLFHWKCWNKV